MTKKPQGTHGCSLWKGIFTVWDFFLQQVELVVGHRFDSGMILGVGMLLLRPDFLCSLLALPLGLLLLPLFYYLLM